MQLTYISAKDYAVKLKMTIHSSGKIGFPEETARVLGLSGDSGVKFAFDEEETMYMTYCKEADEDCFKVCKAGDYFYVNARVFLDDRGLNYKDNSIIFDLIKVDGYADTYKLNKREKPRKK